MNPKIDPRNHACPRKTCPDFGELGRGNVRFYRRYGSGRWALLRCLTCGRSFSERHASPFFRFQISQKRILQILRLLSERKSLRAAAREARVDKNTALKVLRMAVARPRWFQVALVRDFHWDAALADQVYSFVREKARRQARRDRFIEASHGDGP